jgi:hypothetical protein
MGFNKNLPFKVGGNNLNFMPAADQPFAKILGNPSAAPSNRGVFMYQHQYAHGNPRYGYFG